MRQPVSRHQRGQPAAQRPQHQYHPQRHGQQEQRPERPTLDAMLGAVEVFVHAPLVFAIQATGHGSLLGSLPTRYSPERPAPIVWRAVTDGALSSGTGSEIWCCSVLLYALST